MTLHECGWNRSTIIKGIRKEAHLSIMISEMNDVPCILEVASARYGAYGSVFRLVIHSWVNHPFVDERRVPRYESPRQSPAMCLILESQIEAIVLKGGSWLCKTYLTALTLKRAGKASYVIVQRKKESFTLLLACYWRIPKLRKWKDEPGNLPFISVPLDPLKQLTGIRNLTHGLTWPRVYRKGVQPSLVSEREAHNLKSGRSYFGQ